MRRLPRGWMDGARRREQALEVVEAAQALVPQEIQLRAVLLHE